MKYFFLCAALFVSLNLYALNVVKFTEEDGAGRFDFGPFEILNVERADGVVVLPLERDEYKNISVLNKNFLDKLAACFTLCALSPAAEIKTEIIEVYPAGKIFLASVSFDGDLAVTFTVSKNKDVLRVRRPSDFLFKDAGFEKTLKEKIKTAVGNFTDESGNREE